MRHLALLIAVGFVQLTWVGVASAQVSDSQRAAARDLFKQGNQLQRARHFAEALDKFQRAEQVFAAPTNELRIAECEAALGQLVESGEAYRSVTRTPIGPASPPAFQAAVDQAKAEFDQVEPRIPKLVVQVQPLGSNVLLQIDGQNVSAALIGQPLPLDPGPHKASVSAPGFATAEQSVSLKERETVVVQLLLKRGASPGPGPNVTEPSAGQIATPGASPPPQSSEAPAPETRRESRIGVIAGGHLGLELAGGSLPPDSNTATSLGLGSVAGAGIAFGLDGGLRFARRWYVGASLEHAAFASTRTSTGQSTADTTLASLVLGLIVNPDHVSFYAEAAAGARWFHYAVKGGVGTLRQAGELSLGGGVWIPIGRGFRLLPKATLGLGGFDGLDREGTSTTYAHVFFMLGTAGFYNADF
jgi:hypothetical protein